MHIQSTPNDRDIPLQLIFGSDEFFVELRAKKCLERWSDAALEVFDGQMDTLAELERTLNSVTDGLRTRDFFCPQKCIWLRNTNLFASSGPASTEGGQVVLERWLSFLKKLPQETYLVLSSTSVDKRLRSFKAFQSLAQCTEMEESKQSSYMQHLFRQLGQRFSVTIDPGAQELLVQKLNGKSRMIASEVEKLACLNNFQGAITRDCVQNNTPSRPSEEFFEPVEAFFTGNLEWFLRSLRNHFILHKEVRSILSLLQNRNRLFLQREYLRRYQGVQSVDKNTLASLSPESQRLFGPIRDKNTFALFSQNPWFINRLDTHFPYPVLLQLQIDFAELFDLLLQNPKQACGIMENFAQKTFARADKSR
jgi:DNA polymerase III delta subunit